tara:strand:+ start:105 stop:503 length:399 start_codon:yes stop_codon:yes gene_type:complete
MSVIGNSKLVLEKKFKDTYSSFVKDYELYKNQNYDKLILLLDSILEKNNTLIKNIYNEQNSIKNFDKLLKKRQTIYNKMENEITKNTNLNMEKDTFVMLSKEKNKNIEIYYIVYILFSVLLLLIEGSVVIFK